MMRWLLSIVALLIAVGALYYYFRGDPLRAELDRRWPPVTADQQRQTAINSAATALQVLSAPNVAAGADTATIQAIAFDEVKTRGVTKLTLTTDRQLLRLIADFDITLKPEDLPPNSDKRELVARLTPRVAGQIELFLTATAALAETPQRALQVRLLPAVGGVRIDKVAVAGSYDVTSAGDVIALLLNRYADNLSATLSANPMLNVTLPAILQNEFDPSVPIKLDLKEVPDLKVTLTGHPIRSPFALGAAAWLVDGEKVVAIIQLAPLDKLPAQPEPVKGTFEDVKAAFRKTLGDGMGISELPAGVWVAVGKALLAQSLDSAFLQAQPCLSGTGSIPKEEFSAKVPTPNGSSIDCTPHKDCTPTKHCDLQVDTTDCRHPPSCSHNHDTRECNKCLASAFGHCITHGNDPICQAAKAAQNVAYDAAFNACNAGGLIDDAACEAAKGTQNGIYAAAKAKCETDKEADRISCNGQKSAQKAGCETKKEGLDLVHRTGDFANIDGSVSGSGALKLCFHDVQFTDSMDKLKLTLEASGSAALDTSFKFVPLSLGHILCPFPWTADRHIDTTIPLQSTGASVSLAREASSETLTYKGRLDELPVKLHFQPSPLSLVLQNINFELACPVAAGFINGITVGLGPLIPELLKDYTYTLKPITFSFAPDLPAQSVFGRSIKPKLSETPRALLVSGVP